MLLEKAREVTLSGEAEVFGNMAYFIPLLSQAIDRRLDTKRVGVNARAEAGAAAEQIIEMRT